MNRTVGYAVAGYISALTAHQRVNALSIVVKAGLAIGVVTAISGSCTPFVEWIADHVPEKRMGVFGVSLILTGFSLQSVQYWVALLDVSVRSKWRSKLLSRLDLAVRLMRISATR